MAYIASFLPHIKAHSVELNESNASPFGHFPNLVLSVDSQMPNAAFRGRNP